MKDDFVTIAGFVLLAIVSMSPVACTVNRHRIIAEAIAGGADPIDAKCAIESDMAHDPMCIVRAARR